MSKQHSVSGYTGTRKLEYHFVSSSTGNGMTECDSNLVSSQKIRFQEYPSVVLYMFLNDFV